ncbi:MAG: amidohydrolase family protein [Peptococcaceae bacterium]|nr:amidohydrolase family protein [Peptococcaceae bacterium]
MKIYEGNILTCDAAHTTARYLVESSGRIVYVGDELPVSCQNGERIQLGNRALIPAFADTHIHFASFATFHAGLNVMNARSNEEILSMLQEHIRKTDEKLVIAFGASPYSVSDGCLVNRQQLDSICPDKPLFLIKYDGHACVVNTKLLEKVKKKASKLRGYHEESGEMNQEAFFAVSDYVTNSIPILKLVENMQKAVDYMASKGIGMIHTVSGVGFTADLDVDLERWFAAGLSNGMQMRVFMQTLDVKKAQKRKLPRIGGCFEAALDGCFGSKDAAMLEPYEGTEDCGVLYYSDEKVIDFCKKANRAGMQISIHAIGDRAFQQATKALKAALDDYPRENHRHSIIHACLPTDEGIAICEQYGIMLPVQSAFINWAQEPDSYLEEILGERSHKLNPLQTYCEHNIMLCAGSDGPCTDPDPVQWIYKACNHSESNQSMTVQDALRMCTCNGYYASFDEKERGSLEAGKIADMVILSENPYQMEKERLNELKVEQLLLQGKPYQKVTGNPVMHILRGIRG